MKKGYSHVTVVLDNSGSMQDKKEQTIAGFNNFLKQQKADPGTMTFSLYKFLKETVNQWAGSVSSGVGISGVGTYNPPAHGGPFYGTGQLNTDDRILAHCVYDFINIHNVPDLSDGNYVCETGTPLLDAWGKAIKETGAKLAALKEEDRPEKVFFVVLTDGQELHSRVYRREQVMGMVKHQTDTYKWEFVYLGANQDAIAVGASYGTVMGSSLSYNIHSKAAYGETYNSLSAGITRSKADLGSTVAFTAAERTASMSAAPGVSTNTVFATTP